MSWPHFLQGSDLIFPGLCRAPGIPATVPLLSSQHSACSVVRLVLSQFSRPSAVLLLSFQPIFLETMPLAGTEQLS